MQPGFTAGGKLGIVMIFSLLSLVTGGLIVMRFLALFLRVTLTVISGGMDGLRVGSDVLVRGVSGGSEDNTGDGEDGILPEPDKRSSITITVADAASTENTNLRERDIIKGQMQRLLCA